MFGLIEAKMKTVAFIRGKFDPICTKHLDMFSELRQKYDFINVLVDSEENNFPILNLSGRIKVLNSLNIIDEASIFSNDNINSLKQKYKERLKDYTLLSDGEIYMERPASIEFIFLMEEDYNNQGAINEEKDKHYM
jgi:nicotinic acid mononucleotide adenylyltransferase